MNHWLNVQLVVLVYFLKVISIENYLKKGLNVLTPVQTSMALVYETGGNWALMPEVWVDIVSKVVTPKETRAGMAFWSNQKLTQETITNIQQGT